MKLRSHIKTSLAGVVLLLSAYSAFAQSAVGYVEQDMIKVSGIMTDAATNGLGTDKMLTTRLYYDGLGRPLQTVARQGSPMGKDRIQPAVYNALGQQTVKYLPYSDTTTSGLYHSTAISQQAAFYNQSGQYLIPVDDAPFNQVVMENSPLQRMLQSGMTGEGFQPVGGTGTQHYKTISYRGNTNTLDSAIIIWNPDGTKNASNYADNALSVADGTDEDLVETLSYTDYAGRTVLKRQVVNKTTPTYYDTYYVYNNAGMISIVISPKALAVAAVNSYDLTATAVASLLFRYQYDTQGRVTVKTVPGKGSMSIIYDPLNRPVLLQDANLAHVNQWNYIKYDVKGRPISQGIYTDNTYTTPSAMQSAVTANTTYNTYWYETRNTTLADHYYTNNSFPNSSISPLAYSYFDNYDLNDNGSDDYSYHTTGLPGEVGATTAPTKDMPTMTLLSTVGSAITTPVWLIKVIFYDKNLRPIQTQSNNLINYTANTVTDYATTVLDFTGQATASLTTKNTGTTTTVQTTPTYDDQYRIKAITQRYNGGAPVVVSQYNYNELGQATNKGLGVGSGTANITLRGADNVSSTGAKTVTATNSIILDTNFIAHAGGVFDARIAPAFLQQVDYRFNIRGQLTNINNSTLTGDSGHTEQDSNSVFGMQLLYNNVDSNLGNTALYNGTLSAVKWMTKDAAGTNGNERAYKYAYDAVNRYTNASYAYRTGTGSFTNSHGWDEAVTGYDENGNIQHLNRKSPSSTVSSNGALIDSLIYTYNSTNANQLIGVTDATNNNTGFGIYPGGTTGGNYTYDYNGNMIHDGYKDMDISYNVLNRTDVIALSHTPGRNISYIYNANGNMIRKIATDTIGGSITTTDYIGGFVYVNSTLSYFPMPEGRIVNNGGKLKPEYVITDQQGNARITFDNTGSGNTAKVIQENSYYGFGMVMPGSVVSLPTPPNKNLYNGGSEIQNDFSGLPDLMQTFYRNYDAALGRWTGVDPKAKSAESLSVYQYAGNNPIMFNDPQGDKEGEPEVTIDPIQLKQVTIYGGSYTYTENSGPDYSAIVNFLMGNQDSDPFAREDCCKVPTDDDSSQELKEVVINGGKGGKGGIPVYAGIDLIGDNIYTNQGGITANQYLFNWGTGAATLENFAGKTQLGNWKLYFENPVTTKVFTGNQFVTTLELAKTGKVLGIIGAGLGVGLDIRGMFIYHGNPNAEGAVSPGKFGLDSFMTGVGLTGFGTLPALTYFGIDAYYPGGFPAAMKNAAPIYNQLNQPNPAPSQVLWGMP